MAGTRLLLMSIYIIQIITLLLLALYFSTRCNRIQINSSDNPWSGDTNHHFFVNRDGLVNFKLDEVDALMEELERQLDESKYMITYKLWVVSGSDIDNFDSVDINRLALSLEQGLASFSSSDGYFGDSRDGMVEIRVSPTDTSNFNAHNDYSNCNDFLMSNKNNHRDSEYNICISFDSVHSGDNVDENQKEDNLTEATAGVIKMEVDDYGSISLRVVYHLKNNENKIHDPKYECKKQMLIAGMENTLQHPIAAYLRNRVLFPLIRKGGESRYRISHIAAAPSSLEIKMTLIDENPASHATVVRTTDPLMDTLNSNKRKAASVRMHYFRLHAAFSESVKGIIQQIMKERMIDFVPTYRLLTQSFSFCCSLSSHAFLASGNKNSTEYIADASNAAKYFWTGGGDNEKSLSVLLQHAIQLQSGTGREEPELSSREVLNLVAYVPPKDVTPLLVKKPMGNSYSAIDSNLTDAFTIPERNLAVVLVNIQDDNKYLEKDDKDNIEESFKERFEEPYLIEKQDKHGDSKINATTSSSLCSEKVSVEENCNETGEDKTTVKFKSDGNNNFEVETLNTQAKKEDTYMKAIRNSLSYFATCLRQSVGLAPEEPHQRLTTLLKYRFEGGEAMQCYDGFMFNISVRHLPVEFGIAQWEVDALIRQNWRFKTEEAIHLLKVTLTMVKDRSNLLVVPQSSEKMNACIDYIKEAIDKAASNQMQRSIQSVNDALYLAKALATDYQLVELTYVPQEHLFAIFGSLLAPLVLPFLIGLIREWKRYRRLTLRDN